MTSMSLRCSEGFNGGLTQQFMLEVRDSQTSELRANYSSPVPRFTVNSLMPSAIYLASVYAFNTKGRSDPTVVQAAMLRMPEKQPTGEKGKENTWNKEFCRTDIRYFVFSLKFQSRTETARFASPQSHDIHRHWHRGSNFDRQLRHHSSFKNHLREEKATKGCS